MSNEHRHNNRQTVEYPAQIDAGGEARLPCQLQDVSASGTRILVQTTKGIPDDFVLLLAHEVRRFCHVAWRTERELGVKFVAPQPLGPPTLRALPSDEPRPEVVKLDI
jgi:hypothetical protein